MIGIEGPSAQGIHGRVVALIEQRQAAKYLFIGNDEWDELVALCSQWGHEWPEGGVALYHPELNEKQRGKFRSCTVYRVDAKSFLEVL